MGTKELPSTAGEYKIAKRHDWAAEEMPGKCDTFTLDRTFSEQEMGILRRGHIPEQMEDKWFWFMEGDTLFAHRSWTGFCIFRIDFKPDGHHVVTVNRDPEQFEVSGLS